MMHGVVVAQSVHCGVSMWSCGVWASEECARSLRRWRYRTRYVGVAGGCRAVRGANHYRNINEIRSVNIARGLNRFESEFLPSYENRQCARPGLGLGVHRARGVAHRPEG